MYAQVRVVDIQWPETGHPFHQERNLHGSNRLYSQQRVVYHRERGRPKRQALRMLYRAIP